MEINLIKVKESESEKWDKIVDTSPYGTIFHKWKWLKIVEKTHEQQILSDNGFERRNSYWNLSIFLSKDIYN